MAPALPRWFAGVPELPEVEVVRRGLCKHVVGRTITAVTVYDARSISRHQGHPGVARTDDFAARLEGSQIVDVRRRGKYFWLALDNCNHGDALLCHLGMSGQMLVRRDDSTAESAADRHIRVTLELDDGAHVRFCDQRLFGGMQISDGGAALPGYIAHIGRDPIDPAFDVEGFTTRIRKRRTGLKRALLDQSLISGIGNIYADEALWRSRLHYARDPGLLRRPQITGLVDDVVQVMREALDAGGTSFDALYVDVDGQQGYFERGLHVYGHEGLGCPRCQTPIRRQPFMNRSSYICPRCQRTPRRPRW